MLEWISWFVVNFFTCIVDFIILKKYINYSNKRKWYQLFLIFTLYSIVNLLFIVFMEPLVRFLLNILLTIIIAKIIFKEKVTKLTLITLLWILGYTVSEAITILILNLPFGFNMDFFKSNSIGILIINVVITAINFCFFSIPYIQKLIKEVMKWYENKNVINNILLLLMSLISVFFFAYRNYTGIVKKADFIVTVLFFAGVIVIMISLFKEKTNNIKIATNYDQMLEYVKTYETVLEEKSKAQHEYKNQLLLIKSMIEEKEPNIIEEIDKRLKTKNNSKNYKWLEKLKNIPSGGLKGLIHYKISQMLDFGINVYVDIDNSVNNEKMKELCNKNLEDISKILCVYIDNATQAAKEAENKYVMLEAKCIDNILNIIISNTYKGEVKIEKVEQIGYSTKGKSHGYGIPLANEIIKKHDNIDNFCEINGIYFIQKLKIK